MAFVSRTLRPKRTNNLTVSPVGFGLTAGRGTPNAFASGGGATFTDDGTYIRTWEPVDADTLLADDFSTGDWYSYDADHSNDGALTHGWMGTIYANPITPAGAIVGGGVGLHGRPYAATSGYLSGAAGGRNMAQHWFKTQGQTEVYCRYYFKPSADYNGGHEKMWDIIDSDSGGGMVVLTYNYFGGGTVRAIPYLHQDGGIGSRGPTDPSWMNANLASSCVITPNHWHYLEHRCVLNTPGSFDGIYEMWYDDCGVNGYDGPSSPTKRIAFTDVMYRDASESAIRCNGIWIENWANPGSTGTLYYANVYCSKHFVGFADPSWQE